MKRLYRRHGELATLLLLGTATKKQKRELRGIRNRLDDLERRQTDTMVRRFRRHMRRATRAAKRFLSLMPVTLVVPLYADFSVAI